MAEILTDSELGEIEAREQAATPGPWVSTCDEVWSRSKYRFRIPNDKEDRIFIADSRTDIPRLIASHRALAAQLDNIEDEHDKELRRWQDGVRGKLISIGVPDSRIDGAGCDSGDPLDFTLAEVSQGANYFLGKIDELETQVRELTEERQQWLNWADGLTGNQHYLASKMRQEIAERIRTLESACKDTRKLLDFLLIHRHAFISAYKDKINQAVEQLEEAIKHG